MRYEIRAMSFGEILDTGFQLLRNHFTLLTGLSLVIYAPLGLLKLLIDGLQSDAVGPAFALATIIPIALVILIIAPMVGAAITYALGKLYLGEEVTFASALRESLSLILPLVGTSFLSTLVVVAGTLLFILPGVYLFLAFLLLWQVMVLERVFGVAALRRSHELLKGNMGRAFGVVLIGGIVVGVVSAGAELILSLIPFLGPVGGAVAQAIGSVYTTAISVVLYFDIRCRKEAFDLDHLATLVRGRNAPPPLPATLAQ
jgi:hypothetical protein